MKHSAFSLLQPSISELKLTDSLAQSSLAEHAESFSVAEMSFPAELEQTVPLAPVVEASQNSSGQKWSLENEEKNNDSSYLIFT